MMIVSLEPRFNRSNMYLLRREPIVLWSCPTQRESTAVHDKVYVCYRIYSTCSGQYPRTTNSIILVGFSAGVALVVLALLATLNVVTVPIGSALGVGVIALVLIVEGTTRRCLLYRVLRTDRCPVD
ncbi:YgaP family membrane protein [Halorubrum alkaliphilum]|nr:DUF2892 domain-containing protein [Halorubrum alkaliphilum]